MNDTQIVELYWQRDPAAISETQAAYEAYCYTISRRILENHEDTEECVNDTWLRAWNAIPPQRPARLRPFLAKIVRNLSLDKLRARQAGKRGDGEIFLALEELSECVAGSDSVEDALQMQELEQSINRFLHTLPRREAGIFVRRYFFVDGIGDIAKHFDVSAGNVSMILSRTRAKLKQHLKQEGFL